MRKRIIVIAVAAALLSIVFCLCIGSVMVSPQNVFGAILCKLPGIGSLIGSCGTAMEKAIIVQARMPRVIVGFAIGCALATGGAVLQGMVHNQLADPFVLGASYGAASFATLGLAAGWFVNLGIYQLPVNGCIGAMLALVFIVLYSMRRGRIDVNFLLLGGVGLSLFSRALVQFIMKMNPRSFATGSSAFWTEGGLAAVKIEYMKW